MTGFLRFKRKEEIAVASEIKRRFTDTEMQIVRETDLLELLTHLGYQVKRIGRYHTTAEMDSLRIKDRRTWFRYSQNTGGDAITLVQQFCGKTFPEAVEYLLAFNGRARDSPAQVVSSIKQDTPPKPFALPPRNTDDRRVFAYLRKRGIAAQVIRQFMNSGLLYEDAEHHNCVFVGKNSAGQAKYAGLRGTYDRDGKGFRGDVTGSDKNVGFAIPHDPTSDQVRVFEAPIDLMSYLTLHREPINAIALCGLYDGALETYLKDHPSIKRITLCLDADAPGRAAAQQLKDKYSASGYAVTVEEPRSGKDWNEYLQKRNTPERGRYEDNRGAFEAADGHTLLRYLEAAHFDAVTWKIVPGTTYEEAILGKVDTTTPEYKAFREKVYADALHSMGLGSLLKRADKKEKEVEHER